MTCSTPISCVRTAPKPTLLASVWTLKVFDKSGENKTGALVKSCLINSEDFWHSSVQDHFAHFLFKACNGADFSENLGINLWYNLARTFLPPSSIEVQENALPLSSNTPQCHQCTQINAFPLNLSTLMPTVKRKQWNFLSPKGKHRTSNQPHDVCDWCMCFNENSALIQNSD